MTDPFAHAAACLLAGDIVAHPTETVWGLGADPFRATALTQLMRLKERETGKGWILLLPHRAALSELVAPPSPEAVRLMDRFWPGPLTLVLTARPGLPPTLTGGGDSIAVRLSSSPAIVRLMDQFQRPMVSTSANRRGHPPARDAEEIRALWPGMTVLPGLVPRHGLPSTVVSVSDGELRLLRQGVIPHRELAALFPERSLPADTPPR